METLIIFQFLLLLIKSVLALRDHGKTLSQGFGKLKDTEEA